MIDLYSKLSITRRFQFFLSFLYFLTDSNYTLNSNEHVDTVWPIQKLSLTRLSQSTFIVSSFYKISIMVTRTHNR